VLVGATDAGSLRSPLWGLALALPLAGLLLLLAAPSADVHWEHHPSHFWLVLSTAAVSTTLAFATSATALRRADARLFLISLSFLAAAGFLTLHALATPGVLLDGPNQGFTIATPVGLLLAALFAGWSALPLPPARARALMRRAQLLRAGLVGVMVVWAALSLGSVPPLDDPTPTERASGGLVALAVLALIPYAFAAWRYAAMAMRTGAPLLLAVASAFTLLAEAMVAVALARSWHASWWEWHVLMLMAFGAIAYSARREDGEERFSDLYLDHTAAGKREVSVMFADLEGFTSFAEGRDPREVSQMLNAYLRVAIPPIVREHDGEIDRLIGDAIMATWGTRGDQPDHARRAVEAALALQRETGRIAEEHPGWPRFRAAVNSGEALVGVLGAESGRSYTVIGDTVNLAARLESQAPPGRVVIGGNTLRALPGTRVEALEGIRVKGRADPVDAYLVDDGVSSSARA
jgi:adenylate cyclase